MQCFMIVVDDSDYIGTVTLRGILLNNELLTTIINDTGRLCCHGWLRLFLSWVDNQSC